MSLRHTNSVSKDETAVAEKSGVASVSGRDGDNGIEPFDIENGHLQELEVDVQKVLEDQKIEDIESDTSPYPEGTADSPFKLQGICS